MPQSMLPRLPIEPLTPRYRYLELRSRAASLCLAHLSNVHKVSETAVFTAIYASLLSTAGGLDRCHLQLCAANRLPGHEASAVATLTQDVPVCLDLAGKDVAGLIRHCAGIVVTSAAQGRFPPQHLDHARRTIEHDRGLALDLSYWLNSRLRPTTEHPTTPDTTRLHTELKHTTITEVGADPTSSSTLFTYLERHDGELVVRIMADSAYITPDETATWLNAIETMLITTLTTPTTPPTTLAHQAGIPTPQRNHEWTTINHSPIHLPTTTQLISHALHTPVHLTPDPTHHRLLAHLDTPPPNPQTLTTLTPDLIRHCHIAAIPLLAQQSDFAI